MWILLLLMTLIRDKQLCGWEWKPCRVVFLKFKVHVKYLEIFLNSRFRFSGSGMGPEILHFFILSPMLLI